MKLIIIILFWFSSLSVSGQGANTILFSDCGDTLLTRTSCYCKTEDTLTTYFTVLENSDGLLNLISVFQVKEPGKKSLPCADFKLVHKDTIDKYNLTIEAHLAVTPENFDIVSEIIQSNKLKNERGKKVFFRLVQHDFRINQDIFYTVLAGEVVRKKRLKIKQPRLKNIFGSRKINKFLFEIIIEDANIDKRTGKVTTTVRHSKISN